LDQTGTPLTKEDIHLLETKCTDLENRIFRCEKAIVRVDSVEADLNDAFNRIIELEADSIDYSARIKDLEINGS